MQIALWLHLLGVIVWVGGMFFAHTALRPAVGVLEPPARLTLLVGVLSRFFRWVAFAIVLILGSGAFLALRMGGFAHVALSVHVMTALGVVMAGVYAYLVVAPYRRLRQAVAASDWQGGGRAMAAIRRLVGLNLILGLATMTVAVLGRPV
jgi:uncharacterized membrane protein